MRGSKYHAHIEKCRQRSARIFEAVHEKGKTRVEVANAYGMSAQRVGFIVNREKNRRGIK